MGTQTKQGYFYMIPAELVEEGNKTKALLFGLITSLANKTGSCTASNKYLAGKLNMKSSSTISKYISELEDDGWVQTKVDKQKGNMREITIGLASKHKTSCAQTQDPSCVKTEVSNISNSNIKEYIKVVYEFWNEKEITKHRNLRDDIKRWIRQALKKYDLEEIKRAIDNYADVYHSDKTYWTHKWTLGEFLKRRNGLPVFIHKGIEDYKKEEKEKEMTEGVLHDGTKVVKKYGRWVDKNNPNVKLDEHHYPELANDNVKQSVEEYNK